MKLIKFLLLQTEEHKNSHTETFYGACGWLWVAGLHENAKILPVLSTPPCGPWAGAIYASYAQANLSIYGKLFATFDTTSKILQNMHPKEITKMVYNVC